MRNIAGTAGIGLLLAAIAGGGLTSIGPMAYLVVTEYALLNSWTMPWIWAARLPHDHGAAICAALAFATGTLATTMRGAAASARSTSPIFAHQRRGGSPRHSNLAHTSREGTARI
jgi:hypothetical protein